MTLIELPSDYDPKTRIGKKHKGHPNFYLFYYLPNGTRVNESLKTSSKTLASKRRDARERDFLAGKFSVRERQLLGIMSSTNEPALALEGAVSRYRQLTAAEKSEKTRKDERSLIRRIFVGYFGGHEDYEPPVAASEGNKLAVFKRCKGERKTVQHLQEVTTAMVNDFLTHEILGRSEATRDSYRRVIRKVFNTLIADGAFVGENPVNKAQRVKLGHRREKARRCVWIPCGDFKKMLSTAKNSATSLNIADMIELQWEVALRREEMLFLEWKQINFEKRVLRLGLRPDFPTQFGRGWSPKWGRERDVFLTDKAVAILRRQPKRLTAAYEGPVKDGKLVPVNLVFPKKAKVDGQDMLLRCDNLQGPWRTIQRRAGLEAHQYHWHDFRRSWNRTAKERGIDASYRAEFLGHDEEVNDSNYGTATNKAFMLERMGASMAV